MNTMHSFDTATDNAISSTAAICESARLFAAAPAPGEPDPREIHDPESARNAALDALQTLLAGICEPGYQLHDEAEALLWGYVNLFHAQMQRLDRQVDKLTPEIRDLQRQQDGSEVRARNLETAIQSAHKLEQRARAFETLRDAAAAPYQATTGTPWRPRTGSHNSQDRALTAASIEARDYLRARENAKTARHLPDGTLIALAPGSHDVSDPNALWDALDKIHAKHPDMVLLHGGHRLGADRIAASWADKRGIDQVRFAPDFDAHGRAAPFRRNETLLELLPIGILACSGSGITENFIDRARSLGIPVMSLDA